MLAPISLFVYNRFEHTKKTLDALANNELACETVLFIFSDGPKTDASPDDIVKIRNVRQLIKNETRFKQIIISESDFNKGLSHSIISGVTDVLKQYERIIVLEDDIVTSNVFLRFCNEALDKYESNDNVKAISGFIFPMSTKLQVAFFSSWVSCWGWATWKRAWNEFESDAVKLLDEIKREKKIKEFNFNNHYDCYGLLQAHIEKRVDSWAVRWHASVFLKHGLMLYPPFSLTKNIGMDGSGTHYKGGFYKTKRIEKDVVNLEAIARMTYKFPLVTESNRKLKKKFQKYLRKESSNRTIDKIKRKLMKILRLLFKPF